MIGDTEREGREGTDNQAPPLTRATLRRRQLKLCTTHHIIPPCEPQRQRRSLRTPDEAE
jgi:hypothetical protein